MLFQKFWIITEQSLEHFDRASQKKFSIRSHLAIPSLLKVWSKIASLKDRSKVSALKTIEHVWIFIRTFPIDRFKNCPFLIRISGIFQSFEKFQVKLFVFLGPLECKSSSNLKNTFKNIFYCNKKNYCFKHNE